MKSVLQNLPQRKPNRFLECYRKAKKKYPKMYIKDLKVIANKIYKGKILIKEI